MDGTEQNIDPTVETKNRKGKGFKSPGKLFIKKKSTEQSA